MKNKTTKCNHNFKIVRGQQRQYVYKKVCFDCGEVSEMDWEKEFDEQFPRSIEISDRPSAFVVLQSEGEHERRKDFIRKAIQQAIAHERERIYNILMAKQELVVYQKDNGHGVAVPCSDIMNIITNNKTNKN